MESDSLLFTLMESGLAHCKVTVEESGGLLASLFLAGLVGSASHCVGMCGPFVLSQTVARLEAVPAADMREWRRLTGAALVPYHLGRATTYGLLGVAAAYVASGVVDITGLGHLSAALMALGALFFLGYALRRLGVVVPALGGWLKTGGEGWWSRTVGRRARPLFDRPVGWRGYLLGILLGFLPCGLLYGALAAAAAGGDPL
ncbi:MAG: sulfite exporter TauE/SafE family protein, partial [Rhodobacterales bacterium]|nr:sulfite exporter TauE/SafE family protein [Rhodobacterales bacterium]